MIIITMIGSQKPKRRIMIIIAMIGSQRELNTTETTNTHTLSKTTYDKHQEVKRYKDLIQEKVFMHKKESLMWDYQDSNP